MSGKIASKDVVWNSKHGSVVSSNGKTLHDEVGHRSFFSSEWMSTDDVKIDVCVDEVGEWCCIGVITEGYDEEWVAPFSSRFHFGGLEGICSYGYISRFDYDKAPAREGGFVGPGKPTDIGPGTKGLYQDMEGYDVKDIITVEVRNGMLSFFKNKKKQNKFQFKLPRGCKIKLGFNTGSCLRGTPGKPPKREPKTYTEEELKTCEYSRKGKKHDEALAKLPFGGKATIV